MASIEDSVFDFLAYNYTLTAAFTLMVYDTFITFPDEITFIWKGNFRLAPLFYVMTRYGGILSRGVNIYINNAQFHSAQTDLCSDLGFTMNSLALVVWLGIHGLLIMQTYAICHRNWVVLIWLLLLALGSLVPNILLTVTTTCSTEGQVTHATILENTIASITELIFDTLIAAVTFYRILKLWNLQKTLEKNSLTQLLLQQGVFHYLFILIFEIATTLFNKILPPPLVSVLNPMWYSLNSIIISHFLLGIRKATAPPNRTAQATLPLTSFYAVPGHSDGSPGSEFSNIIVERSLDGT